jgi:hypothetical protein
MFSSTPTPHPLIAVILRLNVIPPPTICRRVRMHSGMLRFINGEDKKRTGGEVSNELRLVTSILGSDDYLTYSTYWIQLQPQPTRTTITYHATTISHSLVETEGRVSTGVGWPRSTVKIPRRRNNLPPFLLQWLRDTVSAYYISKAGVLTIIQLLLDSTWEHCGQS